MIEVINWLLGRTKAVLALLGVPESQFTDFEVKVLASLLSAMLLAAITFFLKTFVLSPLARLLRRSRTEDTLEETRLQREYLNWFMDKVKKIG